MRREFASVVLLGQRLALLRQNRLMAAKQLHGSISALASQMGATACAA